MKWKKYSDMLIACPCCGGDVEFIRARQATVQCQRCLMAFSNPTHHTPEALVHSFNERTKPRGTVFTVGNEEKYDKGLAEQGVNFRKLGRTSHYAGGFALRTYEDAAKLIEERGEGRDWAVYLLDADWETDTVPSTNGWWHALLNTRRILRKVCP